MGGLYQLSSASHSGSCRAILLSVRTFPLLVRLGVHGGLVGMGHTSSVAVPEIRVTLLVQLVTCIPEPLTQRNMESSRMLRVARAVNSTHVQLAKPFGAVVKQTHVPKAAVQMATSKTQS